MIKSKKYTVQRAYYWVLMLLLCTCSTLVNANQGGKSEPWGYWQAADQGAIAEIYPCTQNRQSLCAKLVWIKDDPQGTLLDANNSEPKLQQRNLTGLVFIESVILKKPGRWSGGSIYDPKSGKSYKANVELKSADIIHLGGCIAFLCESETWNRTTAPLQRGS